MLDYLFFIGVVSIVFGFVWKWIILIPYSLVVMIIFKVLKLNENLANIFDLFIRTFGYYLMVSMVAIITLGVSTELSLTSTIICAVIGFIFLFTNFFSSMADKSKQIERNYNSLSDLFLNIELIISLIAVIFYVVSLFVPILVLNKVTIFACTIIVWIQNLRYVGTLVQICGTLFVGYIIISGLFISFALLFGLFSTIIEKAKGKFSA